MSKISSAYQFKSAKQAREHIVKNIQSNLKHINSGGFNFALIDDTLANYVDYLEIFDGIIIHYSKWISTLQFLKNIRTHHSSKIMLKPVFLYAPQKNLSLIEKWTIDGLIQDLNLLNDIVYKTNQIYKHFQVDSIPNTTVYDFNINKSIIFHNSRGLSEISPFVTRYSKLGYQFPFLSYFYDYEDKSTALNALKLGTQKQWLIPEFLDTVYVCNNCEDGFLVYREVCPHCFSSNLKEEEIIHHFRCAHVGPLSQFTQSGTLKDELSCPKCYKELQHVGVDYDRPGVIQHCNHCHKDFQKITILTRCSSCSQEIPVEHLFKKDINKFTLTPKGIHEAVAELQQGVIEPVHLSSPDSTEGLLSRKSLHDMITSVQETSRQNSFLVILRIKKPATSVEDVGKGKYQSLTHEIVKNIKFILEEDCQLSYKNLVVYIHIPHSSIESIEEQMTKIDLLVTTLLHDNLGLKGDHLVNYKIMSIYEYLTEWQDILDLMDDDE